MANLNIPVEERNLTPDQVEQLDNRRRWGLTCQVLGGQFLSSPSCLPSGPDRTPPIRPAGSIPCSTTTSSPEFSPSSSSATEHT